jgi:tRNA-specific adenosine deaminase 1
MLPQAPDSVRNTNGRASSTPITDKAGLIATAVVAQFRTLSQKRKPVLRDNGIREWVPLSGIVAEVEGRFTCIALA